MDRPLIVLFVGIPGSGKTTFARLLAERLNAVVLSSDAMRYAMWGSIEAIKEAHETVDKRKASYRLLFNGLNYVTAQVLKSGKSVIFDANANHYYERKEHYDIAAAHNAVSVVVRMRVPYEVSLERIQFREAQHDTRRISKEDAVGVLERFTNEIEEPTDSEKVITIDGELPFDEQYAQFMTSLQSL